uniref:(northern house mosquito) hypothetical protein n=1 Tax=Culex pipiens TaxID=7175 RepID=A0A8D8DKG2_CULPI
MLLAGMLFQWQNKYVYSLLLKVSLVLRDDQSDRGRNNCDGGGFGTNERFLLVVVVLLLLLLLIVGAVFVQGRTRIAKLLFRVGGVAVGGGNLRGWCRLAG